MASTRVRCSLRAVRSVLSDEKKLSIAALSQTLGAAGCSGRARRWTLPAELRATVAALDYVFWGEASEMALKRPKQSKAVAPFKAKEMLDLAPLSKKTADKFRDAMRQ